jgi:ABC-type transport system involved in multi-copper enzyme maturation permease subunit
MLKYIVNKEIQETLTSSRFVFTFLLCTILVLLSVFMGITAFREEQKEYSAAIALNKENINRAKSDVTLANLGIKVNRPSQVLSSIVTGISEASGRVATVTYVNDPSLVDSKYDSSPIFSIFGAFDLAFIVKTVLSLLAILYSYDLIAGEKERGTLRLILSNSVPRDTLLLGKMLGGAISLLVSLIIPLVSGILILLVYPNIHISEQDGLRIVLIFLLFLLYLLVYFALGLFVSAHSSTSSSSLLILLFVWVAFVTLVPKVSILAAAQLRPIKSIHEITAQKDAFLRQVQEEGIIRAREWSNKHAPKTEQEEKDYPEDFKKFLGEHQRWLTSRIDEFNAALDRDYESHKRSQERVAMNVSRISPASALVFSTMSLARTGLDEQDRFLAYVRRYKAAFAEWINAQSQKTFKFDRARGDRPLVDLSGLPQFLFEQESLSKSLVRVLPDAGMMAVLIIVLFVGAYVSFRKSDIR